MASNNKPKKVNNRGSGLELSDDIVPLTENQATVFRSNKNVVLNGCAGTGKTFISSYLALKDIMYGGLQHKLIYVRSIVPTRDIGFLKGDDKQKVEVYEAPYEDIGTKLFGRGDGYQTAKTRGLIEFLPTSFIRGTTIDNAVIVVDECQNMSYHELDSVITRVGTNCRVFFCGDFYQADLKGNGILDFWKVLKKMEAFDFVEFTTDDIVRSDFVKQYLLAKYEVHGEKRL